MLTKKQIDVMPKGFHPNAQIARNFHNHGKKHREARMPINKKGNVMTHLKDGDFSHYQLMRLNRAKSKQLIK